MKSQTIQIVLFLVFTSLTSHRALGGESVEDDAETILTNLYESYIRHDLLKIIPKSDFYVSVTVEPKNQASLAIPYDPSALPLAGLRNQPPSKWAAFTNKVEIDVGISKRFNEAFTEKLKQIFAKRLQLDESRGDRFSIANDWIPESQEAAATRAIARAERQLQDANQQVRQLTTEKEAITRELQQSLAKIQDLETNLSERDHELLEWETDANTPLIQRYLKSSHFILIAVLAIIGCIFAFIMSSKIVRAGFSAVAKSLQAAANQSNDAVQPIRPEEAAFSSINQASENSQDISAQYQQLLRIHGELKETLAEDNQHIVIQHVVSLCQNRSTVPEAVASLEVLGRDVANRMFNALGQGHQKEIMAFLEVGNYPRPKTTMLVDAGETLKTKLLAATLITGNTPADRTVSRLLNQLTIEELAEIISEFDSTPQMAKVLSNLSGKNLQVFLNYLHSNQGDKELFERVATAFANIAEVPASAPEDQQLKATIEKKVHEIRNDKSRTYLPYYLNILESLHAPITEDLLLYIQKETDPQIAGAIQEHIVTFQTFLQLKEEHFDSIVQGLSTQHLAALIATEPSYAANFERVLSDWKQEIVREEVEAIHAKPKPEQRRLGQDAKQQCVLRVKKLKGDGSLAALIESKPPDRNDEAEAQVAA